MIANGYESEKSLDQFEETSEGFLNVPHQVNTLPGIELIKEKKSRVCSSDFIPEICGDCSQSEKSLDQFEETSRKLKPQKSTSPAIKRKQKGDESMRRSIAMSEAQMWEPIFYKCKPCRNTYSCPNKQDCGALFGDAKQIKKEILRVRETYYPPNGQAHLRQSVLIATLARFQTICDDDTNKRPIKYRIKKIDVCKSFYRRVSGLPTRMFDETVAAMEGAGNKRKIDRLNK